MSNKLKDIYRQIRGLLEHQRWLLKNHLKPIPIYAKLPPNGLRIHLGPGLINIQGWINIDARAYEHIHLVSSNFDLAQFSDGSISEIYMCHVLEHFSFSDAATLLKNLRAKLHGGGILRISVPSFEKLVAVYSKNQNDLHSIKYALMGGQDYEYNFHKSVYDRKYLEELLVACGYSDVVEWNTMDDFGVDLGDWSSKSFLTPKDSRLISLNLKASS